MLLVYNKLCVYTWDSVCSHTTFNSSWSTEVRLLDYNMLFHTAVKMSHIGRAVLAAGWVCWGWWWRYNGWGAKSSFFYLPKGICHPAWWHSTSLGTFLCVSMYTPAPTQECAYKWAGGAGGSGKTWRGCVVLTRGSGNCPQTSRFHELLYWICHLAHPECKTKSC